ncbi:MAG TPA: signal recognition particle-docking protein FtsY [Leucothrix sp.]|nr:signal recognition particle-docking protein FtsY [Leucothrix sp.]
MFRLFKKKKPVDDVTSELIEEATQNTEIIEPESVPEVQETEIKSETISELAEEQPLEPTPELASESKPIPEVAETVEVIKEQEQATELAEQVEETAPKKTGLFSRLRSGLSKTGNALTESVGAIVLGKKKLDVDAFEELETRLLMADVGMEATQRIIGDLTKRSARNELNDIDALMKAMYKEMTMILRPVAKPLIIDDSQAPTVILLVGINGAGKTTTIGKLAKKFQSEGKSVMLAAGDTFRAAAVEQLQVWGDRNNIPVVAQGTGADSASVIYDAMESAKAKNIDILLADTAGRLHTQTNLMEELKKVKRVMQKIDENAPHEVMLIVDASIGQNALAQAKEFNKALGLTGITVTKLDGTAKGGILFAIAEQTGIPIRYVGVGESIDDLQEFDAYEFTGALLAGED